MISTNESILALRMLLFIFLTHCARSILLPTRTFFIKYI